MELALNYALVVRKRQDDNRRTEALRGVRPEWIGFHGSTEHAISVFGGRDTGKTYNLALRAARSQHDCVLFAFDRISKAKMESYLRDILGDTTLNIESHLRYANITCQHARRIDIHVIERNISAFMGISYVNKEVMFDDFENEGFQTFFETIERHLSRARHVIGVGYMRERGVTFAKRWFRNASYQQFIDTPPDRTIDPSRILEYRPSLKRQMIEHLPRMNALA